MSRRTVANGLLALSVMASLIFGVVPAFAQTNDAQVRVSHASPDAPAVDVWVDGAPAFKNVAFKDVTQYAKLPAGAHKVQVMPAGKTEPAVISATLNLDPSKDYTVVAIGKLAEIQPLVLTDNLAAPAEGKAHVRFVHASPDAPAVDIAVQDGPVVFSSVAFGNASDYAPVDAGTYNLQVLPAGTKTVALDVPGVKLENGGVYTIFAEGLLNGQPALSAVAAVDRAPSAAATAAPATLPTTGGGSSNLILFGALLGGLLVLSGITVGRAAPVRVRNK